MNPDALLRALSRGGGGGVPLLGTELALLLSVLLPLLPGGDGGRDRGRGFWGTKIANLIKTYGGVEVRVVCGEEGEFRAVRRRKGWGKGSGAGRGEGGRVEVRVAGGRRGRGSAFRLWLG